MKQNFFLNNNNQQKHISKIETGSKAALLAFQQQLSIRNIAVDFIIPQHFKYEVLKSQLLIVHSS